MVDLAILKFTRTILLGLYAGLVGFALGPDLSSPTRVKAFSHKHNIDLRDISFEYPITLEPEVIDQIRKTKPRLEELRAEAVARRARERGVEDVVDPREARRAGGRGGGGLLGGGGVACVHQVRRHCMDCAIGLGIWGIAT